MTQRIADPAREEGGRAALLRAVVDHFSQHGIGDASLRQIAAAVGTSHRMLIYHFGSRVGLLEAVVEELERAERDALRSIHFRTDQPGRALMWEFWTHIADVAEVYGPLYFELASQAMRGEDLGAPLRIPNVEMWIRTLAELWKQADLKPAQARVQARLNLATSRGLLHDLLLTRDRRAVDQAMAMFDWLCFGEPHPTPSVAKLSRRWTKPSDPDRRA
jgi:AcrR family transcriptional regulator